MTDPSLPQDNPEIRTIYEPGKKLTKRIDIGLVTAVCALLVSLMAMLTARAQFKQYRATQKAAILPVIDIDMGYTNKNGKPYFEVVLNNVGAGIAYIQSATVTQNGAPVTDYKAFEDAVMTPRMRNWATLTASGAAGYLPAGQSKTPRSYRFGASASDVNAYLRGQMGTPMDGMNVSVCFCSLHEDCWTVNYKDRRRPQAVKSCGNLDEPPTDFFQNYIDDRAKNNMADNAPDTDQ